MNLVPTMGSIEHPWTGDSDSLTALRCADVGSGASSVRDPFPFAAARLIGRHDLNHQGPMVLAPVSVVEKVPVVPIQPEADVHVSVLLTLREMHNSGCRLAAPQDAQALRVPDILKRVTIPAAAR
ncbi:MAG TPA: hypothetical protein VHJ78_08680 [Actinomycetota bacterium]|nr:hypothetical protein [Actinomycetota bacterium]